MAKKKSLTVQNITINWQTINEEDYICLTDMVKNNDEPFMVIRNWMRNGGTLEFLGAWEELYNPDFKPAGFGRLMSEAAKNSFTISVSKWREQVNGIGLISKKGRGGGTYAHKDIAFEFGAWVSPKFKLLLIREFQRLKEQEASIQQLEWNANRFLTKRNYALHTDAIKNILLPQSTEPPEKDWLTYAGEADILNMALFGTTAKSWRENHLVEAKKGENIRDHATNIQLLVLSNLEAINSELIKEGLPKEDRFLRLAQSAREQLMIFMRDGKELK
ncbi:MAG: KilA-N domain-containing protein [Bacteroidetes bacterium]|nr:KilA-N domain-containing protein [Bacteroidota bacterium]